MFNHLVWVCGLSSAAAADELWRGRAGRTSVALFECKKRGKCDIYSRPHDVASSYFPFGTISPEAQCFGFLHHVLGLKPPSVQSLRPVGLGLGPCASLLVPPLFFSYTPLIFDFFNFLFLFSFLFFCFYCFIIFNFLFILSHTIDFVLHHFCLSLSNCLVDEIFNISNHW